MKKNNKNQEYFLPALIFFLAEILVNIDRMNVFQCVLGDSGIIVHATTYEAAVPSLRQDVSRAIKKLTFQLKLLDALQLESFRTELYRRIRSRNELKLVCVALTSIHDSLCNKLIYSI